MKYMYSTATAWYVKFSTCLLTLLLLYTAWTILLVTWGVIAGEERAGW